LSDISLIEGDNLFGDCGVKNPFTCLLKDRLCAQKMLGLKTRAKALGLFSLGLTLLQNGHFESIIRGMERQEPTCVELSAMYHDRKGQDGKTGGLLRNFGIKNHRLV
jgi:hypothetical protein